jgi:hypothetical protein
VVRRRIARAGWGGTRVRYGANRLVVVGRPVEPCVFVRHWLDGGAGCGRRGVVSYLVLLYHLQLSCIRLPSLVLSFPRSVLLLHSLSFFLSLLLSLAHLSFRPPLVLFVIGQFCTASFRYRSCDDHREFYGRVATRIRGSG